MKPGDLVKIGMHRINPYTVTAPVLGIYLRTIPTNHPSYSPSFPTCEILTPRGVRLVGIERIEAVG